MHVFYTSHGAKRPGLPVVYEQTSVKFCCAEFERQWGRLVGFGARGIVRSTSRDVNLYTVHPQVNGFVLEVTAIAFCPFCGAAVKVAILPAGQSSAKSAKSGR